MPLFVPLAPCVLGGGDRDDVALSYVYADSGCVAANWLCVLTLVSLFVSVCALVRVVIICPASTHTALVSSPSLAVLHLSSYLPTLSRGSRGVSRALRGGRGKEEPLSAIATVLHAAPGDDGLPPPGPPRHTSAA